MRESSNLSLLLLLSGLLFSSVDSQNLCISPGGRFPPFSSNGKPPKRVAKGPKDLALCRVFRKKTCCDIDQTYPALVSIRKLASSGQASQECLQLWELLECSICDPSVGTQPGPPVICTSLCDSLWRACGTAYFSMDSKTQVLSPCGPNDILCGAGSEWASNGTDFCSFAGFSVSSENKFGADGKQFCYGEKASLDSVAESWKASKSWSSASSGESGVLYDFHSWAMNMTIAEKISWAVGGMVLTAGLLFISKRKSYSHRQKQAAILRQARKLETRKFSAAGGSRAGAD